MQISLTGKVELRVNFAKWESFFVKKLERRPDFRLILLEIQGFFLQNDWDSHDLSRSPGRSDGRERPAMWPGWASFGA